MIKTGFCVSYDWQFLKNSLPRVYEASDKICLAVDANRMSWGMQPFEFDEQAFLEFVKSVDHHQKVIIYQDEFSVQENNARANCNRHRTMIADKLGPGGWHIQVDSDEYFLDFPGFTEFLKKLNPSPTGREKPFNVLANWIPLYKKLDDGYLYVDFEGQLPEMAPFASTRPQYDRARHNGFFNVISPYYVVHETWARSEEQLWFKLNNWGHAAEELNQEGAKEVYFDRWKSLNKSNYRDFKNVNATNPAAWPGLNYSKGRNIDEFLEDFDSPRFPLSDRQLQWRNNRNLARVKHLFQRLGIR